MRGISLTHLDRFHPGLHIGPFWEFGTQLAAVYIRCRNETRIRYLFRIPQFIVDFLFIHSGLKLIFVHKAPVFMLVYSAFHVRKSLVS